MHDGHGVPNWTYSELSFQALSGLPEYYVNQNDKRILPHLYVPYELRTCNVVSVDMSTS